MDLDKEIEKDDGPPPYIPGTIKKIKLQNFMCHDSFEMELGSRVNFVIGPNGSGKSALLTAIVVVLGGRASTTSRAKRNSEFVQYGKQTAKIVIELHNYDKIMEKDKAFKPDEYGKKIIIEKIIPKDPDLSAKLILKSDREKRISERKSELDEILDYFKIQTNNPICILNQEVSKSFLHSKKPEDKFDLFFKATSLEQIENDYNEAKESHRDWNDCNVRKEFAYKLLDTESKRCKEKLGFLMNRCKLQDESHQLNIELIWALLRDQEVRASAIDEELSIKRTEVDRCKVDIKGHQDKIQQAEIRIDQHKIRVVSCKEERDISMKKRDDLRTKELRINERRLDAKNRIEGDERKLARLERDKASLEKSIADVRQNQNCRDSVRENEKRRLEIEQLKREKPLHEAKETALRQRTDQLRRSMTDIKQDVGKAFHAVSSIRSEISIGEANLRTLSASQEGDLSKYGAYTKRICDEVDRAFKEGRFTKKPFGPVGHYIKLKTEDVSPALEIQLGNFSRGFVCDNHSDMLALDRVFKTVKASSRDASFREPVIFVRQYKDRFDPNKYRAHHEEYKTLIDHIDVSESAVFNALLDRASLEQALYIPDYNEALNIMMTPNMIPQNTKLAYTKDRHILYPRTRDGGFRSVADDRQLNHYFSKCNQELIAKKRKEIEILKENLRSAESNYQRLSDMDKVHRSEYDASTKECEKIMTKLREIENKLLELQTTVADAQPQELSVFEDELEKCMALMHETKSSLEAGKLKLVDIEAELVDAKREKEEAIKLYKLREEELEKVNTNIASEKELIKRQHETIKQIEVAATKIGSDIEKLNKQQDDIQREIATHEVSLSNQTRPTTIRPTDLIRSEKRKIEAALNVEIEENQDPDELIASLRKRREEIAQMVSLKDHNLDNYGLTEKSLHDREEGFRNLKKHVCNSVSTTFASMTRVMEMTGKLNIYLNDRIVNGKVVSKARTLEMSIDTSRSTQRAEALSMNDSNVSPSRRSVLTEPNSVDGPSSSKRLRSSEKEKENHKMTDTRSLSGGERSFSTVAFVLSLWHHCQSPFKLMDEIDVFMDMVTRRISYNALIRFARATDSQGQFIYFSPLELPEIEGSENLVRVFEMPRIIRRGNQSLPVDLSVEFANR